MPLDEVNPLEIEITLNGSLIQGLLHASIVTTNLFSSDSFALTFASGAPPLGDLAFWSSLEAGYVEIHAAPAYGLSQDLISGMIDTILIDPLQHTASIEGRDLSSSMIDGYRQQDFVNQTASEVVSTIALNHGLTTAVTATLGSIGRYYGDGYTRLSLGQFSRLRSDWDLIVQLARENSFDVFVQGTTLFFQPANPVGTVPIQIRFRDIKTIRFERTLTVAPNITARVQSWNSQNMASYSSDGTGDDTGEAPTSAATNEQPFLFSASNFTSQQVADSAGRYTAELRRLGVVMHIEMPWNLTLTPRTQVFVNETGSVYDTFYQIDHIERHYSAISGSTQTVRAVTI